MGALATRFGQVRLLLRFRPFDTSDEAGRSLERYRRILHNAASNALVRATTATASLITVPLTFGHLGAERYGMFLTIASFIAMLSFADLGLGNGVITEISRAYGKNDDALARRTLASALSVLSLVGVTIIVAYACARPFLHVDRLFNVHDARAVAEAEPALAVMIVNFALSIPLAITQRARLGYQQGASASLWEAAGAVLRIIFVFVAVRLHFNLPMLVLANVAGPLLCGIGSSFSFFIIEKPFLIPRRADIDKPLTMLLLRTGLIFVVLQLATNLVSSSDNVVIAQVFGPESVPAYDVPMRMFTLGIITTVAGMIVMPMWPAYGEAFARGDRSWIRKALQRTMGIALTVTAGLSLVLVFFGQRILDLWVGSGKVAPSFLLLAGMGLWAIASIVGTGITVLLNACGVLIPQVACTLTFAIVGLGAKIAAAHLYGTTGVIWSMVASYVACSIIPMSIMATRLLREPA